MDWWWAMERGLRFDEASLTSAARGVREAAEVFGRRTDALLAAVAGDGRSPWGDGVLGAVMDQINEMAGRACRHLHTNLGQTAACYESMRDQYAAGEQASTAVIRGISQNMNPAALRHSV